MLASREQTGNTDRRCAHFLCAAKRIRVGCYREPVREVGLA